MGKIQTLVVKVGSALITSSGEIQSKRVEKLAEVLADFSFSRLAVVSSGAVAAGAPLLGLGGKDRRVESTENRQAAAAVGQGPVFSAWREAFQKKDKTAAQILLTAGDLAARSKYLNIQRTFHRLFELGAVPVINENDTVSIQELVLHKSFGDNDALAALTAGILNADLLLILSDVDGLYDKNPHFYPDAKQISEVEKLDHRILKLAGASHNEAGRGGMRSKLLAVRKALHAGCSVAILKGTQPENLRKFLEGEPVGTLFQAKKVLSQKRRWIGYAAGVHGVLTLDDGAVKALQKRGASLLPSGIIKVSGSFKEGDIVSFEDLKKQEIGRGMAEYPAEAVLRIQKKPSKEIRSLLGYVHRGCVVHRNNMTLYDEQDEHDEVHGS